MLDMFVETCYICWWIIVTTRQAYFRELPVPILIPTNLEGFALMLFPYFVMLLHMPKNIRDTLVIQLIMDKLGEAGGGPAPPRKSMFARSNQKVSPPAAAERQKKMNDVQGKIDAMRRVPQLQGNVPRVIGGCVMASSLAFAIWVTAVARGPGAGDDDRRTSTVRRESGRSGARPFGETVGTPGSTPGRTAKRAGATRSSSATKPSTRGSTAAAWATAAASGCTNRRRARSTTSTGSARRRRTPGRAKISLVGPGLFDVL